MAIVTAVTFYVYLYSQNAGLTAAREHEPVGPGVAVGHKGHLHLGLVRSAENNSPMTHT